MFSSVSIPRATVTALGTALAYGGGFWLVLLHRVEGGHERHEPALLLHWLRDATLALPIVLLAVWLGATLALGLLDGERRLPARWRSALVAAGAALAAAVALAAGSPVHALLFEAEEGRGLPVALHLARDALLALAAVLPIAAAVVALEGGVRAALRRFRARRQAEEVAPPGATGMTRGALVRYGAAGLATAGLAGAGLSRWSRPSRAAVSSDGFLLLYINEGFVPMVDGTLVYMRGYGESPTNPTAPNPSLTIGPHVFRNGFPPVASRTYPLNAEAPDEGCPDGAGIDPSGPGLHFIRRRHWASFFPRRTLVAETGTTIMLRITNRLSQPHTFTIDGVVNATIPADNAPHDVTFAAPAAGTYVYRDTANDPVNRVLGLAGVLVVVPASNPWTFDGSEGEFERQWVWIFHDIDPEWARRARMGLTIDPAATPSVPRYFTINGRSGVFSIGHSPDEAENRRTHEDTTPCGHGRKVDVRNFSGPAVGTGQLLRLVNTGIAVHQPHFHGNHVWTIAINGGPVLSRSTPTISPEGHVQLQHWEDVVELEPLQRKAVILPLKVPPDALDVVVENQECEWVFPMHCHAEMSQTAGGGLYPGGMVSDWHLRP